MTTIASTAEPANAANGVALPTYAQPTQTSEILASKIALENKEKKKHKTEREKSKPVFEKKE